MGDSRDLNQKRSSSFEIEDNSGIELSLGLACGKFVSKAKGNISVEDQEENKEKEKNGKACLGSINVKDFCQRSQGDKEDNGKQHSGSLPQQKEIFWTSLQTNTSKEPEKFTRMCINEVQFPGFGEPFHAAETSKLPNGSPQLILSNAAEKNTQAESSGALPNKNNTDTMLNDLQFSLHVSAGGAQFAQSNFPAHFLGTLGNGNAITGHPIVQSCASASLMQNSIQLVGTQSSSLGLKPSLQLDTTQGKQFIGMENVDTDQHQRQSVAQQHWQDDTLEQHKIRETSAQKWQEARKKRKLLIEEQKQQKKAKRDDERAGPHGFRRPGSNTWVRGWEPPAPSFADVERSKTTQYTLEGDERASEICNAFQQVRDRNTKDNEQETDEESSESQQESNISDNSPSPSAKVDEVGKSPSVAKEEGNSPKRSIRNQTEAQQCMTLQTDGLQRKEESEEQECKMLTVGLDKPLVHSPTVGNNSNSALANMPSTTSITLTSTTLPYSVPSFPVMPAPYSLPTPVPNHPNVPFPVGYPFVYLMQYPPPAVDVTNCAAARPPIYPNGYQLPLGYAPFQLPMNEGSPSWVPVLRPQQSPPLAPNFGGPRNSLEPKEDETKVSQGVKLHDKQKNHVASLTDDTSEQITGSLNRSDTSHNSQDQYPVSDFLVPYTLKTTPSISLGPSQALSSTGKTLFPEHGKGFAVKVSQDPFTNRLATHETKKRDPRTSPRNDETMLAKTRNLDNSSMTGTGITSCSIQKDESKHIIGRANMTNSFPQEAQDLRPGIACEMMFGGSGTTPDLPWVSTSGVGPNGKTICGVLYRYDTSQIRIVCACHGRHMSHSEFVHHAATGEYPGNNIMVEPYVIGSEAASTQG